MEIRGYYIKRTSTGKLATSLSQGEKSAVALVYFLSKMGEDGFELKDGVVVIDDPVSSLDSNYIFQAFGFIKAEMKMVGQLFIFTHNFEFFKNVKHWFKEYNKKEEKKAGFFMIENFFEERRFAKISLLDKLLEVYDSEYQYLFSVLYDFGYSNHDGLKKIYPIPNVARKFMETFLSFKFPSVTNFDKKFSKAKQEVAPREELDVAMIERIKRFVNAHSHADIDTMTTWNIAQWSEGRDVVKDCLNLVKRLDSVHYEGLKKCIKK